MTIKTKPSFRETLMSEKNKSDLFEDMSKNDKEMVEIIFGDALQLNDLFEAIPLTGINKHWIEKAQNNLRNAIWSACQALEKTT